MLEYEVTYTNGKCLRLGLERFAEIRKPPFVTDIDTEFLDINTKATRKLNI